MLGLFVCTRLMVLAQFMLPGVWQSAPEAPPAPAAAAVRAATDNLSNLTIARLIRGEEKLTPADLGHLHFWISLVREPAVAAIAFLPRVFVAATFFFLFWAMSRGIRKLLAASMRRSNVDSSIHELLSHLSKWGLIGMGAVIAFNQLGIQIGGLVAGVSIMGLAIGLAAQETLANLIAGIVIFCDQPFRVGDIVNIDNAVGTVQRVTFRSTRMLTFDGEIVVLPNTAVLAHKLLNHSAHNTGRINISVGISYSASIDAARQALLALVATDERVRADPQPAVVVSELADSSVRLNFWFWSVDKGSVARLKFEYMEKVKEALDAAGIEIPFPHMNILLHRKTAEQAEAITKMRVAG